MVGTAAEQAVIGGLLSSPSLIREVLKACTPDDFSDPRLGKILAGIKSMIAKREPVSLVTVDEQAMQAWGVHGVTGVDLAQMMHAVTTTGNLGFVAKRVHEAATRRRTADLAGVLQVAAEAPRPIGESIAEALERLTELRDGARDHGLETKTLTEVLEGDDSFDWVVPHLLERRDRLILTGGEGAGKSTFVRQLAVLSAAGIHPVTFEKIPAIRVLVVDAENSERQWRRAVRWVVRRAADIGTVDPGPNVRLAFARRLDLTTDRDLGRVHRLLDDGMPDVLFIGPLYRLVPRAIQSDDDAAPLLSALDSLRDRGPALVMEAHAGHSTGSDGNRDLRPRGSSALMGWPEFGLGIRPPKLAGDPFDVIRWRGDRDEREWPRQMIRGQMWPWERTQ